jgi:hypothetical protein
LLYYRLAFLRSINDDSSNGDNDAAAIAQTASWDSHQKVTGLHIWDEDVVKDTLISGVRQLVTLAQKTARKQ